MRWSRRLTDSSMLGSSRLNSAQTQLLKTWIAAILWLGPHRRSNPQIMVSAENTSRFLYPLLHFLLA